MNETETRKCSYILMLVLSIMVASLAWLSVYEKPEKKAELQRGIELFAEEVMQVVRREPIMETTEKILPEILPEETLSEENWQESVENLAVPVGDEQTTEVTDTDTTGEADPVRVMGQADVAYFDDALFIGDSRTVGLSEYGGLGNAEVAADTGMSVYKIFKNRFTLRSGEEKTLEEVLAERQFGKIYIMLGINELGYDFEYTVGKYQEMLDRIREMQPDAIFFLEANLHITKKKSETSDVYSNASIDRFNQAVSEFADGETIFYLDINELFDDGEGNLAEEYTADAAHILAKYYPDWTKWLLGHAVFIE